MIYLNCQSSRGCEQIHIHIGFDLITDQFTIGYHFWIAIIDDIGPLNRFENPDEVADCNVSLCAPELDNLTYKI
jgi:hypothetical protein